MKYSVIFILELLVSTSLCAQDFFELCEDTCNHIHGIDISHYQGDVFWDAAGENRQLAYVYLKATEGGDNIDSRYAENIYFAKKHGIKVGSYHFFRPRTDVNTQLDNFSTQCRPTDQDLIPMIDVETRGGLSVEAFCDSLVKFLHLVEAYYGQKPLIYSGANFYNKYLMGLIDPYPIMIAQYTEYEPVLFDGRDIMLWQYTSKGYIAGVNGFVDKSRFMNHHTLRELRYRKKEEKLPSESEIYPF